MESIKTKLKQYPSSFDVAESIKLLSNEHKETIKNKLLYEMDSSIGEFSTYMEKIRAWNLLSYICFILGDRKGANDYNCKALETNPDNIIALSNKARFSLEGKKNFKSCEEMCEKLKKMKGNRMAYLVAKAEIAFTYSRLGLKLYKKAVSEFREVIGAFDWNIEAAVSLSSSFEGSTSNDKWADYYCVWMYGCALSVQRLCHVQNMHDVCEAEQIKDNYKYAAGLFCCIINLSSVSSECIKRYQARTYVEMGFIAYGVTRMSSVFPDGMANILPEGFSLNLATHEYFKMALDMFPEDVFVLERSGKYFRYVKKLHKSIELLNKAIEIKETSFGHHHLALSYIRLLELESPDLPHLFRSLSVNEQESRPSVPSAKPKYSQRPLGIQKSTDYIEGNSSINSVQANQVEQFMRYKRDQKYHGCTDRLYSVQTVRQEDISGRPFHFSSYKPKQNAKGSKTRNIRGKSDPWSFHSEQGASSSVHSGSSQEPPLHHSLRHASSRRGSYFDNGYRGRTRCKYTTQTFKATSSHGKPYKERSKTNFERKDKPGIKCPRYPVLIDYEENKEVVEKILTHLDRAAELSTNTSAMYDKSLLYRQIRQPQNALDILEPLMQNSGDINSPVMMANIYEQAAFCINDILDKTTSQVGESVEQLRRDRDVYLQSSIEISCNLVPKIPSLGRCWKSATTLKQILLDKSKKGKNKQTLRDLWFVYDKLNSHFEAIGVLKELQDLAEDDTEKNELIEEIVKRHLLLFNYEEAVIALCVSKRLEDGSSAVNQSLYLKVYIEAGLDAFRKKHFEKARLRIRMAFENDARREKMTTNEEDCFELFILSNIDDDEKGRQLTTLLSNLGLKATFNTDSPSVTPGTPEIQGITEVMEKSKAFAILLDFDVRNKTMQHITDRLQKIVERRDDDTLIVMLTPPGTEFPPSCAYSTYKQIFMEIDAVFVTENVLQDESMYESIKSLLIDVAMSNAAK